MTDNSADSTLIKSWDCVVRSEENFWATVSNKHGSQTMHILLNLNSWWSTEEEGKQNHKETDYRR